MFPDTGQGLAFGEAHALGKRSILGGGTGGDEGGTTCGPARYIDPFVARWESTVGKTNHVPRSGKVNKQIVKLQWKTHFAKRSKSVNDC